MKKHRLLNKFLFSTTILFFSSNFSLSEEFCLEGRSSSHDYFYSEETQWSVFINWERFSPEVYDPDKFTITFCNDNSGGIFSIYLYGEGGRVPNVLNFLELNNCGFMHGVLTLFYEFNLENDTNLDLFNLYNLITVNFESQEIVFNDLGDNEEVNQISMEIDNQILNACML